MEKRKREIKGGKEKKYTYVFIYIYICTYFFACGSLQPCEKIARMEECESFLRK